MKWLSRILIYSPICYGLCTTEKDFHKELKRLKIPREDWPPFTLSSSHASVHHFEMTDKSNECAIVCLAKTRKPKHQVVALLAHEATHIWQWIRENIGEKYPSSEFEAYCIQAIVQELVKAYYGN